MRDAAWDEVERARETKDREKEQRAAYTEQTNSLHKALWRICSCFSAVFFHSLYLSLSVDSALGQRSRPESI